MTTLNQIRAHSPCTEGWTKLLKHLNKTTGDDEPLSLLTVLESNGLEDAIWCLRTEPTPERIQRFALAVARRVEHQHPQAKTNLDVVEHYLNGTATKDELDAARARARARAVARARARAVARAVAWAAAAAADAAGEAAEEAVARALYAADAAAAWAGEADAAEREAQVQIFKEIFA